MVRETMEGVNDMSKFIEKLRLPIGQAKDVENAVANADKFQAFMDYVAACDYPEIIEDESEVQDNE